MDDQTTDAAEVLAQRLAEYERSGDASAIDDEEMGRHASLVAVGWRAAPRSAWHPHD